MSDHRLRNEVPPRPMRKTAGEVRFIKDHGDDSSAWAWGQHAPAQRVMDREHKFNVECSKDMAKVLRSTLAALGHAMSAYSVFAKIKSRDISPDGNLGGRGYIMEIKAMRRQYMNIVEALSAISDTLYDEVTADHWTTAKEELLFEVMQQVEDIKDDPEGWAVEQETSMPTSDITTERAAILEEQKEKEGKGKKSKKKDDQTPKERDFLSPRHFKTASATTTASRVAERYLASQRGN